MLAGLVPQSHSSSLGATSMSSPSLGQDAESINEQRITNYLHLAGLVLLTWDHALTLSEEIKCCWKPSGKITIYLFLFNRYFTLLANVAYSVSLFNVSLFTSSSCEAFFVFREVSLVLTEAIVSILLLLRIYAIYECSKRVLIFMLLFGMVLIGLVLFALIFSPPSDTIILTPLGCHWNLDRIVPHAVQGAAAWEALFVYDCLLFIMVVLKGYKSRRNSMGSIPILEMILRDGAVYFAVMALANLANILTFYFASPYTRGGLSTISTAMSVTLISRLTLNLRASASMERLPRFWSRSSGTDSWSFLSTLHFKSRRGHEVSESHELTSPGQSVGPRP